MANMDMSQVISMLKCIQQEDLSVAEALKELEAQQFQELGFAKLDHQRAQRTGLPEAVFAVGKTTDQLVDICSQILSHQKRLLITKLSEKRFKDLSFRWATALKGRRHPQAQTLAFASHLKPETINTIPHNSDLPNQLLILSAGTADIPVATEAYETAMWLGLKPKLVADVGIAGIQRLLAHQQILQQARVIIVVAGMDGALPAVVAGLTKAIVIATPTSVGYGSGLEGIAALLTMLNSCVPGVLVVNIDNGFGAACAAVLILKESE